MEEEEGAEGTLLPWHGSGLWLVFNPCLGRCTRSQEESSTHGAAAAPPACIPRALRQQWREAGISCGSLASEGTSPLGAGVEAGPALRALS